MIQDLNNINIGDLNLCVVSFGGSASNTLVNALRENGFNTKNHIWEKILCHCPKYVNLGIPIIYLYTDPRAAFMSMKRRGSGIWDVNQKKLSNNNNVNCISNRANSSSYYNIRYYIHCGGITVNDSWISFDLFSRCNKIERSGKKISDSNSFGLVGSNCRFYYTFISWRNGSSRSRFNFSYYCNFWSNNDISRNEIEKIVI